jgi:hypothetical protein
VTFTSCGWLHFVTSTIPWVALLLNDDLTFNEETSTLSLDLRRQFQIDVLFIPPEISPGRICYGKNVPTPIYI